MKRWHLLEEDTVNEVIRVLESTSQWIHKEAGAEEQFGNPSRAEGQRAEADLMHQLAEQVRMAQRSSHPEGALKRRTIE